MEKLVSLIPIVIIILLGFWVYKLNKKSKKLKLQNYEKEKRKIEEMEKLKLNNPEEYKRLNKELKESEEKESLKKKVWKKSRIGLWILVFPHLIFETILSDLNNSSFGENYGVSVVANFLISRWYIKRQIFDKEKTVKHPILYGIGVGLIVFCLRLILGYLSSILLS